MTKKQSPQKAYSKSKQFLCCVTGEPIHPERVEYLLGEGIPEYNLTSINGANATYRPKKIIVVDDEGTEFLCDKIDETRAWAAERFGAEEDEAIIEDSERKSTKKVEEVSPVLIHESLDIVLKKEDTEEEDEI